MGCSGEMPNKRRPAGLLKDASPRLKVVCGIELHVQLNDDPERRAAHVPRHCRSPAEGLMPGYSYRRPQRRLLGASVAVLGVAFAQQWPGEATIVLPD